MVLEGRAPDLRAKKSTNRSRGDLSSFDISISASTLLPHGLVEPCSHMSQVTLTVVGIGYGPVPDASHFETV